MAIPANDNVLLQDFDTPFGVPPFASIRHEHYLPALKQAIARHDDEVAAIATRSEAATFANTIEALERSGALFRRVRAIFDVLNESMTDERMQKIADDMAPLRTRHIDDILMNERLFARIRAVWETRHTLDLGPEQSRLLERTYQSFVRGGAALDAKAKERLRAINEELAGLTLRYSNNILAEDNRFTLVIDKTADLAGLPPGSITEAAEAARTRGLEGRWVFTLRKPSLIPFLQYSERRALREKMFKAYVERGNHDDKYDNKATAARIVALRAERASLLGFPNHAAWVLDDTMAKTSERALALLRRLWPAGIQVARREAAQYEEMIRKDGHDFELEPWDWFYYATRVQKLKYEIDDELLRPYFKLENVNAGAFAVATRLWGIQFVERRDVPAYHPDVRVYEVREGNGEPLGIVYTDYSPRESKRGGAWMNVLREQSMLDGKRVLPVVTTNGSFTRPTADKPSLLTLEEVNTLFHEFGHVLHGLLTKCTYERLAGTNVPADFVELPSQIMENWATDPEVMPTYARHYETGEPIPQELIARVKRAERFNQGFATVEYLAASFLDLDYHLLPAERDLDIPAFEKISMETLGLIREIVPRYRSTYFNHIFGSADYAAGYYSYIWAEVLDADAFQAFKERGVFDAATADAFRRHILEKGNTEEPMDLYKKFRGAEPKVEPLLERRGLL